MNLKRIKTTVAAGVLAASMILPNMTAFAAVTGATDKLIAGDNAAIITKEIVSPEGVTYTNDKFTFTFTQKKSVTEESNVKVNQSDVTIPAVDIEASSSTTGSATNVNDTDKKTWTQTITKGIDLSGFTTTGVWIYDVAETANTITAQGETWTYSNAAYVLRVYVSKNAAGELVKQVTIADASGDKQNTAKFTNKMTKTTEVTLTKTAKETELEPVNQEYEFKVTITNNSMSSNATITYSIDGVNQGTFNGDNIKIKSGQKITFSGVPAGSTVAVEEVSNPSNVKSTTINYVTNAEEVPAEGSTEVSGTTLSAITVSEDGAAIAYTNTWQDITVTGVVTNIAPYVTLVVVAVAAIAAYVAMKKRIAR